jgi:alkanesulfonate monooxygenase SsuD/methylene tetrahydromethanopterin reductase-like flavin-dependent oxidoreductase (luciferase family)
MKFHFAINLERMDDATDMRAVRDHTIEMVKMADAAGFEIAWAAEHHALEMTIAPNPFQLMTWWADHTTNIRLGCGVANAAYWHPINLAGEAAMVDLLSGGRLELGLGSGAYQREFDRMKPGLKQSDAWRYMQEMLPVVRDLWKGDVAHEGEFWNFPTSTSVPKPVQDEVPVWIAARSPITYDYAMRNRCHVNCWPLTRPFAEAELYRQQLDEAIAKADNGWIPRFALMRHACLYDNDSDRQEALNAIRKLLSQFENLFRNSGNVVNGFPASIPLDELEGREQYDPAMLEENLMFGSPDTAIQKLKGYQALGVNEFIYYASMGLSHAAQKRSLRMFVKEVMPEFK